MEESQVQVSEMLPSENRSLNDANAQASFTLRDALITDEGLPEEGPEVALPQARALICCLLGIVASQCLDGIKEDKDTALQTCQKEMGRGRRALI